MKKGLIPKLAIVFFFLPAITFAQISRVVTLNTLWNEYKANPYNHPNIPNNSYAGYRTGNVSIPTPAYTVYNVTSAPYNAVVNDANDDQPAIQAAIDAAGAAGSGIVFLPAGTYVLKKPLYIKYNNVIVRGAALSGGIPTTILDFKFSMYSMFTADIDPSFVGPAGMWYGTGLVWIGPGDSFKANGAPDMYQDYEQWRSSTTLATVTATSAPGTFTITVNSTASLAVGMKVLLRYTMPTDNSFIKRIHNHPETEDQIDDATLVGDCTNIKAPGEPYYYWPAIIQSITGNVVKFDRPLRLQVDASGWVLRNINSVITESGVENLFIKGHSTTSMGHLVTPTSSATAGTATLGGWNGVYINRSWNCWAQNIRIQDMECGVIFSAAKNCSALNTYITSSSALHWYHHPYALRVYSSDNLVENFTISGMNNVRHGINAEWYSSGNVYSKGMMKVGTFDSHRASAFDLIRTEITVANDAAAKPGGAATSGPFAGKRFAMWNITQAIDASYAPGFDNGASRNGDDVYEPLQFPMSAFVCISGPRNTSNGESMVVPKSVASGGTGYLGSVEVTGAVSDPTLTNLYTAELNFRNLILPVHITAFNAIKTQNHAAHVTWSVAEAEDNDRFIVQWCNDGINFKDIYSQNAVVQKTNYEYDHNVSSWNTTQYYRLKVISAQGSVFYSEIKSLKAEKNAASISIYPNPIKDRLVIRFSGLSELQSVRIMNSAGQVIKSINGGRIASASLTVSMNGILPGQYYVEAITNEGITRQTFIKQ